MKRISETILFFGSGPVAAASLDLLQKRFIIEAVITKPKPEHHRGDFPVISTTEKLGLAVHTAQNKQELSELMATGRFSSRIAVLIDFGIIVTKDVIDYFPLGIVNSHFSLLPEWRGADPISFAILSGQEKTGVSLMLLDEGMDTGMLIGQKSMRIDPSMTTPELTEALIRLSDEMLGEYLPKYIGGTLKPRRQPHPDRATYSRKLSKEDGVLDLQKPAVQLEREIRAFAGWPKSRTEIAGKEVVITKARVEEASGQPGSTEIIGKNLYLYTGEGALVLERLKPAGKKEMTAESFIAGYGKLL